MPGARIAEGGWAGQVFENLKAIGQQFPNAAKYTSFEYTLVGNIIVRNPVGLAPGQFINFRFKQAMGGGWRVDWDTMFKFPGGTPPIITVTNGAVDFTGHYYCASDNRLESTYLQNES